MFCLLADFSFMFNGIRVFACLNVNNVKLSLGFGKEISHTRGAPLCPPYKLACS